MRSQRLNFKIRYILALSFFLLLSFGAFVSISNLIHTNKNTSKLINISGRQRMLSQRISKYAILAAEAKDPTIKEQYLEFLRSAIDLMEKSHIALTKGDERLDISPQQSEEIQYLYFQSDNPVDTQVKRYLEIAKIVLVDGHTEENVNFLIKESHGQLLTSLDNIVNQYDLEGKTLIQDIYNIEKIIFSLTILLIILEILFIFMPTEKLLIKNEKKMKQQIEKLEKLNDDLEKMTFACSHNLQEPNRLLLMHVSGLEDKLKDFEQTPAIENTIIQIKEKALAIRSLISRYRDYLAINNVEINLSKSDIYEIIESCIDSNEAQGLFVIKNDLPEIFTDSQLLKIVFAEIISNAITFHKNDDNKKIDIGYQLKDDEHHFQIRDYGVGVDKKYLEEVFKPFVKLNADIRNSNSGMGLSICKKIIEKLNGKISIRSKLRHGVEIAFSLPNYSS